MYKFNTEDEYQIWCHKMIMSIYYARIAMNNEKIKNVVQEIGITLHCSEGEQLVAPSPITFVISWSTGQYEDYDAYVVPFKCHHTKKELETILAEQVDADKENAIVLYGADGMKFDCSLLTDYFGLNNGDLTVHRLDEWIGLYKND